MSTPNTMPPPPPGYSASDLQSSPTASSAMPPPPPGYSADDLVQNTGASTPTQSSQSSQPSTPAGPGVIDVGNPSDSAGTTAAKGVAAVGAGVGQGLLHTLNGAADLFHLPHATLQAREQELKQDNAGNPTLNTIGYGGETLAEFMLGDEALKGLSFADKLQKVGSAAKILENSPRVMKALQMGANVSKAIGELGPEEQALIKANPYLARLVGAGMDAVRAGAVQGAQTAARTDGSTSDKLKAGAEDAATMAGTAGVIGGATGLVSGAVTKAGEAASKVKNLSNVAENAGSKEQVAESLAARINAAEDKLHTDYESGVNDLKGRLGGTEIDSQENPMAAKAEKLLANPVPEDHPAVAQAHLAAGEKLDKPVRTLLETIANGTDPAATEAAAAEKGAEEAPTILGPDGKPVPKAALPEPEPEPARPYNINDLIQLRQSIRKLAASYEPGDINARTLKSLLWDPATKSSAIDDTIGKLAEDSGDDTAVQDYQDLRTNYSNKISNFSEPLIDKIRAGKMDDAAKDFVGVQRAGSALPSAGKVRYNTDVLKNIIGPDGLQAFGKDVFGTMLKDSMENGRINPAKFVQTWKRVTDETKGDLFNVKDAQNGLAQLSKDAESAASLQHLTRLGLLGAAGATAGTPLGLGAGLGTALGLLAGEGSGFPVARDFLNRVANNPRVWTGYEKAAGAVNSPAAKVAATAVKGAAGQGVSKLRQSLNGATSLGQ